MVRVTNFHEVESKEGQKFITLELTGGLELIQSSVTGNFYATARKCSIPSTFELPTAQLMVGQEIEGDIVRVSVPTYEFLNKRTGEIMRLQHSFAYRPPGEKTLVGHRQLVEADIV